MLQVKSLYYTFHFGTVPCQRNLDNVINIFHAQATRHTFFCIFANHNSCVLVSACVLVVPWFSGRVKTTSKCILIIGILHIQYYLVSILFHWTYSILTVLNAICLPVRPYTQHHTTPPHPTPHPRGGTGSWLDY